MNEYWDRRFRVEGKIWGDLPSRTAIYALELFRKNNIIKVLVPGSGYGRNTRLFSSAGYEVTGIDISAVACIIAHQFDPVSRFYNVSALDMSFIDERYDAIFCFNTLHLFLEHDRYALVNQCKEKLKNNGLMFFTVFSDKELGYGKGLEIEKNTFESRPGRPAHYFSENDLEAHFPEMAVLETGEMEDPEDHGEGPHIHILRYICLRKP
jgi:SAM-dependent methyltransferase